MATITIKGGDILKITRSNGDIYWLPNPSTMEVGIQDLDADGTGRNQLGEMFRDRVAVKRKVSCTFPPMNWADISNTLAGMQDAKFSLEYPDPWSGTRKTITAYVGDRTSPIFTMFSSTPIWQSLSANFVEF